MTVDPVSTEVAYSASEVRVALRIARDCLWTAGTSAEWMTASPASGQGDGTLAVAVAANPQQSARTGSVSVNQKTVTIAQAAAPPPPCSFSLNPPSRVFGDRGGSGAVELTAEGHCDWSASTSAFWISFTSATSGSGTATITYTVSRNFGRLSRTSSITIAGQPHLVVQSGLLDIRSSVAD